MIWLKIIAQFNYVLAFTAIGTPLDSKVIIHNLIDFLSLSTKTKFLSVD